MKEMLEIEQGFLDCCVLPAALFSEAMWGRGRQLTVTSSLVELPRRSGHSPSPKGLISLRAYISEEKTDSGRSRVPRWASSSESASVILTSVLLPEYFWDLSNQLPLLWISFSRVVRCPRGPEPCCLHSFRKRILASSWEKKSILKSSRVSGVLEMLLRQIPCPHCWVQLCISGPVLLPHHLLLSLALNLIHRCRLSRLPELQKITWKASPKVPVCHTVSSASAALSRHLSSLKSVLNLLMLQMNALQSTDVGSTHSLCFCRGGKQESVTRSTVCWALACCNLSQVKSSCYL